MRGILNRLKSSLTIESNQPHFENYMTFPTASMPTILLQRTAKKYLFFQATFLFLKKTIAYSNLNPREIQEKKLSKDIYKRTLDAQRKLKKEIAYK